MSSRYKFIELWHDVNADLRFYGGRSPKAAIAVFLFDARFRLMCSYRVSRYLYLRQNRSMWIHRWLSFRQRTKGANDFSPKADIGTRIVLPHPVGIVIGGGVVIEKEVTIYQQVTFGSHGRKGAPKEYPVIGRGAVVFAGAKIVGGVSIGARAIVGANSVVTTDIPEGSKAAGIPARVLD